MKILSIETSSKICSIALLEDKIIRAEYNLNLGLRHSEFIFSLIDRVLNDCGWQISHLQGIAVDQGPGSFTGIRIGLVTARTLAQLLHIPLVGVVSLDALVRDIFRDNFLLSPLIDALGGEVYTCLYQNNENKWQRLVPPQLTKIDSWLDYLYGLKKKILFLGEGSLIYDKKIENKFGKNFSLPDNLYPLARNVAYLGREKLFKKKNNFQKVLPLYLRPSYAEIKPIFCPPKVDKKCL